MSQLPFNLDPVDVPVVLEDTIVTSSNAEAFKWLESWPQWHGVGVVFYGPEGAGKSHLLKLWAERAEALFLKIGDLPTREPRDILKNARAIIIDDFEPQKLCATGQRHLFHLYNILVERRGHMVLSSSVSPSLWRIELPDLSSRLKALSAVAIDRPDQHLMKFVMMKLFADRQMRINEAIAGAIAEAVPASLHAAIEAVKKVDRYALANKRKVTLALAKEALREG